MKLKENFTSQQCLRAFITIGAILTGIFLIGYVFNRDLYYVILQGDHKDVFMDFFNSVSHSIGRDPYGIKAIYPPLCYVIYWILGRIMGDEALDILSYGETSPLALRGLSQPMIVFGIYFVVSLTIFIYLAYRLVEGKKYEKICFLILITISVPFMFQFERANIIFLSLLGTMAFFVWKDSENKYLREIALVCLALSAGLKIYPAILGLVLLKEKRYKETLRLIFYGILCFFLPFLFIRGGFHNVLPFIKNLTYTSTVDSAQREGYKLGYSAIVSLVIDKFSNNALLAEQIGNKISIGITVLGMCAFPWLKKSWKSILLLICLLVGVPAMSYTYTSIFFIIPLIFFFSEKDSAKDRWIYFILFLLIFFPLPFGWNGHSEIEAYYIYNRSFNSLQASSAILAITVILLKEGLYNFVHLNEKHLLKRRMAVFISFSLLICLLSVGVITGYSQALSDKKEKALVVEKTLDKEKIIFNGKKYRGVYKGQTVNNKPSGEGTFSFSKRDGNLKLIGKWQNSALNGNIKIVYPDGTYETTSCEDGQIYGNVMSYSENGALTGNEWYYQGSKLSNIEKSAVEIGSVKDMKVFNSGIVKCQGKVTRVIQSDTFVEVTVDDGAGQKYLISYYNSVFGAGNQIKAPNLKKGDKVVCYGTLNGKDTKNLLGMDLISAKLVDNQGTDTEVPDYSYGDIMRYPYKYVGKTVELQGSIKEVVRDFENNALIYTVEENKNNYALVIGLGELFATPYSMPDDEKEEIVEKLEKTLPTVGENIKKTGTFRGNFIWEDVKQDSYKLRPYIYTSAELDDNGKYIFEQ